jgi:hypothetical protein
MSSMETNQFSGLMWSKEASGFFMAGLQWDANSLEALIKSPYPLILPSIPSNNFKQPVYPVSHPI